MKYICIHSLLLTNKKLPNTGEGANDNSEVSGGYAIQLKRCENSVQLYLFISMECCQHTFSLCRRCSVLSVASKYFSYNMPISYINTFCRREESRKYPTGTGFCTQLFETAIWVTVSFNSYYLLRLAVVKMWMTCMPNLASLWAVLQLCCLRGWCLFLMFRSRWLHFHWNSRSCCGTTSVALWGSHWLE